MPHAPNTPNLELVIEFDGKQIHANRLTLQVKGGTTTTVPVPPHEDTDAGPGPIGQRLDRLRVVVSLSSDVNSPPRVAYSRVTHTTIPDGQGVSVHVETEVAVSPDASEAANFTLNVETGSVSYGYTYPNPSDDPAGANDSPPDDHDTPHIVG